VKGRLTYVKACIPNGNKRIAITALLTFLYSNGKWLKADTQELYNFTVWVAMSPSQVKEQVVAAI
jgi:prophage maintenance system killer protein